MTIWKRRAKGGHGRSYLTLSGCCKLEKLRVKNKRSSIIYFSYLMKGEPKKVSYLKKGPRGSGKVYSSHSKSNMTSLSPPFPDCQNTTSQCSLEQKIKVKTFLDKFLVQIEFQCCVLLKNAIFNSSI